MTTTASTAAMPIPCDPKAAIASESEKIETMTTSASAATVPNAWTKSARARSKPRRSAAPRPRSSTSTLGTASPNSANQASARK